MVIDVAVGMLCIASEIKYVLYDGFTLSFLGGSKYKTDLHLLILCDVLAYSVLERDRSVCFTGSLNIGNNANVSGEYHEWDSGQSHGCCHVNLSFSK